jgi:hypothetical protein
MDSRGLPQPRESIAAGKLALVGDAQLTPLDTSFWQPKTRRPRHTLPSFLKVARFTAVVDDNQLSV